jgi:hypothetical protein
MNIQAPEFILQNRQGGNTNRLELAQRSAAAHPFSAKFRELTRKLDELAVWSSQSGRNAQSNTVFG